MFLRPKSRRRFRPTTAAEVLEERALLSWMVMIGTTDDFATTKHGTEISGNVLQNDYAINYMTMASVPLSASVGSSPSSGQLSFASNGDWTFEPAEGFVGVVEIVYTASANTSSKTGKLTITVENWPPMWAPVDESEGFVWAEADGYNFQAGQLFGELHALDPDGDRVVFGGEGTAGLVVQDDGRVIIANPSAFTEALAAGNDITIAVTATDGIATIHHTIEIAFGKVEFDWFDLSEIYMTDSNGVSYNPDTGLEFYEILKDLKAAGGTISTLIIGGHGNGDKIELGDGYNLNVSEDGMISVQSDDEDGTYTSDWTNLFNELTDANTTISLRGCNTLPLAKKLKAALGGEPKVYGNRFLVIRIPGTSWELGF